MEETWVDKLVQQSYISDVRRFAIGALLAASISWGWPAFVATGVVATAISGVEFHYDRRSKQKALLNLYKDEVAAMRGKSPADVTIDDLEKAAQPVEKGGNGVAAIKEGLDRYEWDQKFRWFANLTSSAIVTGALVASAIAFPVLIANMSTILGLGLVGMGYLAVNRTVRAASELVIGHQDREERFNQGLIDLTQKIKKEPLQSKDVFEEFVYANKALAEEIKQDFGKSYSDLTVIQKQDVINQYEPRLRIASLTHEINHGRIKPGIIGLLAFGQECENVPDYVRYKELFKEPVQPLTSYETDAETSKFAHRIRQEQELAAQAQKTLH